MEASVVPIPWLPLGGITLLCAELYALLVRHRELTILIKSASQRTFSERMEVERGLCRSVILELVLFVPASSILVLTIISPVVMQRFCSRAPETLCVAIFGLLGVLS